MNAADSRCGVRPGCLLSGWGGSSWLAVPRALGSFEGTPSAKGPKREDLCSWEGQEPYFTLLRTEDKTAQLPARDPLPEAAGGPLRPYKGRRAQGPPPPTSFLWLGTEDI